MVIVRETDLSDYFPGELKIVKKGKRRAIIEINQYWNKAAYLPDGFFLQSIVHTEGKTVIELILRGRVNPLK